LDLYCHIGGSPLNITDVAVIHLLRRHRLTNNTWNCTTGIGTNMTNDVDKLDYTEKVIYCGIQNNVLLHVYSTTIFHIQNQNKVVECLVAWFFTMPHVWKMFLSVMINHC
jgi:hypothetical protein